MIISFIIC